MTTPSDPTAPRTPLSKQRVLQAALRFADQHGLETLSMRRLGQELGVEAMSLYKHVANKEALLDGLADLLIAEIEVPAEAADWQEAMRKRAQSAHQMLLRHPWGKALMGARLNIGPAMVRYVDVTLGWLLNAGFSVGHALDAWHALDSYIYGYALQELNLPFEPEQSADIAAAFLSHLPAEVFPHFHRVVGQIMTSGRTESFEFGLDLLLAGLERVRTGQKI
ncbi:TetR/AcrR family transcriptional regulator [Deinococcus roseus]|nr:TetR/AcrR family transcriptional regulator C-terminal domain-containing protein [Deinococcus roseus]